MSERTVCIHGHFYQPPRENPWLERIELQESAYPYHDWNERITVECYGPNARSRILDDDGRISRIVNNYARISFNFGPTLLSWMQVWSPEVYDAVLDADRLSLELFDGHGSAMAQAYNHLIMPLAHERDQVTQVRWGIVDFVHRFGRTPEGMWLPETAVDLASLAVLASHGIRFTVLAPHQAMRVRGIDEEAWTDVRGGKVDPTMPYRVALPNGQSIVVFFYDGPRSRGVAFEGLLNDGARFARRLQEGFGERQGAQIVHIATDGESYGHHHRHGDMALAYATCELGRHGDATLTNYGAFLERFPPTHEAEILEETSWSCAHGIERWRNDCGCKTGSHLDWHQAWRRPLRDALDWLRDELAAVFERIGSSLLEEPWAARDAYIDVILDRSPEIRERFLAEHAKGMPDDETRVRIWQLLEMQRHALLMYTSCGWFFDDVSRIEAVQILRYAGRAIQLAESVGAESPEEGFLDRLAWARSNDPDQQHARHIYETQVKASMASLAKVAAHYSMRSLFDSYEDDDVVYCYQVERDQYAMHEAGRAKLGVGRVRVTSKITGASSLLSFAVVHFGDHTLNGGVRELDAEAFAAMAAEITAAFKRAELTEVVRLLDRHFGERTFSLSSLFRDAQHRILDTVLESTTGEVEAVYGRLFEQHAPLMRFLGHLGLPVPAVLHATGEQVLNSSLRRAFESESIDLELVHRLLDDAREAAIELDREGLAFALETSLERLVQRLESQQGDATTIQGLTDAVSMARALRFGVDLTRVENAYFEHVRTTWKPTLQRAEAGDERAAEWSERMRALADLLHIRLD